MIDQILTILVIVVLYFAASVLLAKYFIKFYL